MGPRPMGSNGLTAIIDYQMGNVRSVWKAFEYLGGSAVISNSPEIIKGANRIVLPGVGAFGDGMENLKKLGLIEILQKEVVENKKPFLGICLGMQLLADNSEEFGFHKGLGWIEGSVKKMEPEGNLKVPHVGWNEIKILDEKCPLFSNIKQKSAFYFVHSFHFILEKKEYIKATCDYGQEFASALQKDNIFAVQFHPEKSQLAGLKVLENFLAYG